MALQQSDEVLYDVRLIERNIARGLYTREALEKRRAANPDMAEHADIVDLDQLGTPVTSRGSLKKP